MTRLILSAFALEPERPIEDPDRGHCHGSNSGIEKKTFAHYDS